MDAAGPRNGVKLANVPVVNSSRLRYVLVTPARNEDAFIELTIQSVVNQTVLPAKWVVVSDGSTDGTDAIVNKYAAQHKWIELVQMPPRADRHFAGKVAAFNAGYERVNHLDYEVIGSLDADITFESDYFSFLLSKFQLFPQLGVVGTPFVEEGQTYDYRFSSTEHVSGACQLFRRQCFEAIGAYTPVKGGGIDVIAVLTARMKGWQTRTFPERPCLHHRPMGSASAGMIASWFKLGRKDYALGRHPLWQCFRAAYQMSRRPWIVGGTTLLAGYLWALLCRIERPVSDELIQFQRREQIARVKSFLFGPWRERSRREQAIP